MAGGWRRSAQASGRCRKKLLEAPGFRTMVNLVANGVPWHIAFAGLNVEIDDVWSLALCIAFGERQGAAWNWQAMAWENQS